MESQKHLGSGSSESPQPPAQGLAGRELDAAVAERVMGWTRWEKAVHPTDNRTIGDVLYCPPDMHMDFGGALNYVPHYSTDTAAAMKLIEKMRQSGEWCCIDLHADFNYVWKVSFTRAEPYNEDHVVTAFAVEDSLPLAISRAALAAIEGKEK
jgi:hypothetical protein